MRRFLLPAIVLAVVIAATAMAGRANDTANATGDSSEASDVRLATPLLNVRRAPEWLRQPASDEALQLAVAAATAGLHENDAHCVSVRRDGIPIADINASTPLIPGAVQRLVTLEAFGSLSSAGFTTKVVRSSDGVIDAGVLDGDLWLVGGADPVLSTAAYIERFGDERATTSLESLAAQTVAALQADGITEITGQLIADHNKYGPDRIDYASDTWTRAETETNEVGALSALVVNNGFEAFADTVDLAARGRASSPPLQAADEFRAILEANGIVLAGGIGTGDQPAALAQLEVASISSPPLTDIARRAYSDGTVAEMLYLEFGVRSGSTGGDQASAFFRTPEALISGGVLDEAGRNTIQSWDGSGLSLVSLSRCDLLNNILDKGPDALAVGALPASVDSTVAACTPTMLDDLQVYAAARPEVTSIVGRATTPNGDVITFSMIVNWAVDEETGALLPRDACDGVVAALLDAISKHPDGGLLADFSPLDVVVPA